ncbi:class I SAM-dependent methyltransferase [Sphingobacterium daejeonense]|uniref:class I SAM-dependent methyltransferase n=1 Tax=Sphingobacterium daejeonense TaxID=371142 RepID=UPI0021A85475|nr:class I SAM-dependent methyltransferase [Sphingobacterium daejeonense]MCT1531342.1 class I SAM-dependent methyltransferase [Sphingobacterium daejeonense]
MDRSKWNNEFKNGRWSYLKEEDESIRYIEIANIVNEKEFYSILDLGCGECILLNYIYRYSNYVGVDISEIAINNVAVNGDGIKLICSEIETYQTSLKYDFIIFNESLYYLKNSFLVLNNYVKKLNRGGKLILSIFNTQDNKMYITYILNTYKSAKTTIVKNRNGIEWVVIIIGRKF